MWLVLLAAAGMFALTMGTRQTMGLFLSSLNTSTGLGVGSIAMGWAVGRWRMKSLLSLVYATRALAVLVFLLLPKTGAVMLVFAAVMGLTFLSTVPPTAGLVAKFFGTANMATLFGIVMLAHQLGCFLGAALIHMPIREARVITDKKRADLATSP